MSVLLQQNYSLTDLLRHASRMAGNSRKTIKDIAKPYILIMYIQRYLNVKVDKNKPHDVNIARDKPPGVSIASGKSVNLSVDNQKSLGMHVTKGQLPNVNVVESFVGTMEEYIKEPVKGHVVTDEYVHVKDLIVTTVPSSMNFNGKTTDR